MSFLLSAFLNTFPNQKPWLMLDGKTLMPTPESICMQAPFHAIDAESKAALTKYFHAFCLTLKNNDQNALDAAAAAAAEDAQNILVQSQKNLIASIAEWTLSTYFTLETVPESMETELKEYRDQMQALENIHALLIEDPNSGELFINRAYIEALFRPHAEKIFEANGMAMPETTSTQQRPTWHWRAPRHQRERTPA